MLGALALGFACDPGPVEVEEVDKLVPSPHEEGEEVLVAALTPGDEPGDEDNTFLRYHAELSNPGTEDLEISTGEVGILVNDSVQSEPYDFNLEVDIHNGQPDDLILRHDEDSDIYKFEHISIGDPIEGAAFEFAWADGAGTTTLGWEVIHHRNPTFTGGYYFPGRQEDLHPGEFWSQGIHNHSRSQAYALDLSVVRERNGGLTNLTEKAFTDNANGIPLRSRNDHYNVWGRPVYAMAGGNIIKCRRAEPDSPVPGESIGDPNVVVVDHGNGEYASYAHLMFDSVPPELCPEEIFGTDVLDPPIPISAGTFIGKVGSSGTDGGPHMHLVVNDSPSTEGRRRSLPINFGNVAVHGNSSYDPGDALNPVSFIHPKAMGVRQILKPNLSGWPLADLALGHQYGERDGSLCWTREGGVNRSRVDLVAGQTIDARNGCNLAAEVEVTTHADWTFDIDAHERSGEGRTLLLSSYDSNEVRKRNLALDWIKLQDGASYVYVISLRRIDADTVDTWTLHGSGHLFIDIGKHSMTFEYGDDDATASIGFLGVGATKRASLHSWDAPSSSL